MGERRKWDIIIPAIIVVVVSVGIFLVTLRINERINEKHPVDDWDRINTRRTKEDDGWLINITYTHVAWTEGEIGIPSDRVHYWLQNSTGEILDPNNVSKLGVYSANESKIVNIRGTSSQLYGIIWSDNDNNNLLNKGDSFFIPSGGGSCGCAKSGDIFVLCTIPPSILETVL